MKTVSAETTYGWVLRLDRADYGRVLSFQRGLVRMRKDGFARDTIIFVEHPPVVTVGRNGHEENFKGLAVEPFFIERGGDVTYHGPGQLVVYFIFNLARRGRDLHLFMDQIQQGVIRALAEYGLAARKDDTNTGVWVGDKKIASIGIAVKNWITYHGTAINVTTDLADFAAINPCGLKADVMTTLARLTGRDVTVDQFADVILARYSDIFRTVFTPVTLEELAEDVESQTGGNEV
ncbi:MAG: lipoyl(octanoyl) transferase LipB [candidate division Zixibacteria bacterium]|jgi:lipoate-protein ligase B|nr:lipoyl(octanoyl) transferase LipB [candidate division Zixibacteria bacterium]